MTLDEVNDTFTQWAPYYDATHAWSLPLRRQARRALDLHAGDKVLDLACGTGLNFHHLQWLVGESGRVIGVDLVQAMLEIANQRIQRHGWTNVESQLADAARLPFPKFTFDKAICAFALNIIPVYISAIRGSRTRPSSRRQIYLPRIVRYESSDSTLAETTARYLCSRYEPPDIECTSIYLW